MLNFNAHSTKGRHLLVDYYGCCSSTLNDLHKIEEIILKATEVAKMNIVGHIMHSFDVEGISGVVLIAESHLSIHTWPSQGYASVDCYTCGEEGNPFDAHEYINKELGAKDCKIRLINRGMELFGLQSL